jgi:hypothetical protein
MGYGEALFRNKPTVFRLESVPQFRIVVHGKVPGNELPVLAFYAIAAANSAAPPTVR